MKTTIAKLTSKDKTFIILFLLIIFSLATLRFLLDREDILKKRAEIKSQSKQLEVYEATIIEANDQISKLTNNIESLNNELINVQYLLADEKFKNPNLKIEEDSLKKVYEFKLAEIKERENSELQMQMTVDSFQSQITEYKQAIFSRDKKLTQQKNTINTLLEKLKNINEENNILIHVYSDHLVVKREKNTQVGVEFSLLGLKYIKDTKYAKKDLFTVHLKIYDTTARSYLEHLEGNNNRRKIAKKTFKISDERIIREITFENYDKAPFKRNKSFVFELYLDGIDRPVIAIERKLK